MKNRVQELHTKAVMRRVVIPRALHLSPRDVMLLLELNGFTFASRACPFKLHEPKHMAMTEDGRGVIFEQWEDR